MKETNLRDELSNVYAEEVIVALPRTVHNACDGCKNGLDKNTLENRHNACTLPRKNRIDLFAATIILSANESSVREKLFTRLQSRQETFDVKWVHVDRNVLLANKTWMRKIKKNTHWICKYM